MFYINCITLTNTVIFIVIASVLYSWNSWKVLHQSLRTEFDLLYKFHAFSWSFMDIRENFCHKKENIDKHVKARNYGEYGHLLVSSVLS